MGERKMNNKVSVIVPVYNASKFLNTSIQSIIQQTYTNIEIVLINDGSTDDSLGVMEKLQKQDNRIKIYSRDNKGTLYTRIEGAKLATGQYIMYMDADDLLSLQKIERQVQFLMENDTSTVISSEWDIFYHDISEAKFPQRNIYKNYERPIDLVTDMLNTGNMMLTSCWLMTRELIKDTGGWDKDITINDDGVFFTKVLTLASKVIFCPNAHVYYRRGHESLSTSDIYSESKLQALFYSYMAQAEILLSVDSSLAIKTGIARNMSLVMCKAKYGSPLYHKAISKIECLGQKPLHPYPYSKTAMICKIIGFENFLKIRNLWKK